MAEPLTRIRHRETHEWRHNDWQKDGWTLHYLPSQSPNIPVRHADRFETELLDECKRLVDDARGVLVGVEPSSKGGA